MAAGGGGSLLIPPAPPGLCDQPSGLRIVFSLRCQQAVLPAYLCVLDQSSSHHKTKVEHKLKPTFFDDVIPRRVQAWLKSLKITHRISQTDFGEGK